MLSNILINILTSIYYKQKRVAMQMSTIQPVFKLELNHKVTPGAVIIAKYDGTHPCLTASAGYDKV